MIVIAGTLPIKTEERPALEPGLRDLIAATLQEQGCVEYAFGFDVTEPGLIRIFEIWESDEALAAHARSEHVAAWGRLARPAIDGPLQLTRYVIESAGPYP